MTGKPRREFLYIDDLAEALIYLSENYSSGEIINVGPGEDLSIKELGNIIKKVVGYNGKIVFNTKYPDGTMRKVMDTTRIKEMGWSPRVSLDEGIRKTYEFYKKEYEGVNNWS